eukprot:47355-Eustigmatos_ZCMA.PRE.1
MGDLKERPAGSYTEIPTVESHSEEVRDRYHTCQRYSSKEQKTCPQHCPFGRLCILAYVTVQGHRGH